MEPDAERKDDECRYSPYQCRKQELFCQQPADGMRFGPNPAKEIGFDGKTILGQHDGRQQEQADKIDFRGPGGASESYLNDEIEQEDAPQDKQGILQSF